MPGERASRRILARRRALELTFSLSPSEQIINVWRPLAYPAVDCPLAAMDYRTLDAEKDLVPTDLIL
jgi:hypothetical protein